MRQSAPPPSTVLRNPPAHCLQLTVDFMSDSGISSLAANIHLPFYLFVGVFQSKVNHVFYGPGKHA